MESQSEDAQVALYQFTGSPVLSFVQLINPSRHRMEIITEGTLFPFLLFFFFKTYTWIWHQLPAPLRGFQLPNNKQIRGQRTMYSSVRLCVQLWGCARLQTEASPGCSANSDVKVETPYEGLRGPKNTNFVAHPKWIILSILSLLVSIPSWKAASSPNSSWGQNGASFLRYYKPVWAQKRIQCSRPNNFKANNPPESVWDRCNCQCQLTPRTARAKLQ